MRYIGWMAIILCAAGSIASAIDCNQNGFPDRLEIANGKSPRFRLIPAEKLVTPQWPISLFARDLNGDKREDLIAETDNPDELSIFFNRANGNFMPVKTLSLPTPSNSPVFADLDGDGDLDLVVCFNRTLNFFFNQGDGKFNDPVLQLLEVTVHQLTAADLNGDGAIDLAGADFVAGSVHVIVNEGFGTFFLDTSYTVGAPVDILARDLNSDGQLDLLGRAFKQKKIWILFNQGGSFNIMATHDLPDFPVAFVAGDVSGDGQVDLVSANSAISYVAFDPEHPPQYPGSLTFLINDGKGGFTPGSAWNLSEVPKTLVAGDLDGDGDLDLAAASEKSGNVAVFFNSGKGGEFSPVNFPLGGEFLILADLNSDGSPDLAAASLYAGEISPFLARPDAPFGLDANSNDILDSCESNSFLRGDADGDGSHGVTDAIQILKFLFLGDSTALGCLDAADANDDGDLNITDPVNLLLFLFGGREPPRPPFVACGKDPGADTLSCKQSSACRPRLPEAFVNSLGMRFIYIPPGTFEVGSPRGEPGKGFDENFFLVRLTRGFYLQESEVTQGQFQTLMRFNPSLYKDYQGSRNVGVNLDRPVESVSWTYANRFCERLSESERRVYRLPTEAEWEYACRAETTTPFSFGSLMNCEISSDGSDCIFFCKEAAPHLWWCGNSPDVTQEVGRKQPNPWGLHDMHGNVSEWCQDRYALTRPHSPGETVNPVGPASGEDRVVRGGDFSSSLGFARSAKRRHAGVNDQRQTIGFRVVLELPDD